MNSQSRPFHYPTVPSYAAPASPAASAVADAVREQSAMDQRWKEWKAKGRRDDVAFREKLRVVGTALAVAVIAGLAAMWGLTGG